jgi:hypothetical protein
VGEREGLAGAELHPGQLGPWPGAQKSCRPTTHGDFQVGPGLPIFTPVHRFRPNGLNPYFLADPQQQDTAPRTAGPVPAIGRPSLPIPANLLDCFCCQCCFAVLGHRTLSSMRPCERGHRPVPLQCWCSVAPLLYAFACSSTNFTQLG